MAFKDVEELRSLIIELELPGQADVLFGIRCAVCGKTDRICLLESPDSFDSNLKHYERYKQLWSMFKDDYEELGVCKFCGYVLSICRSEKVAKVLIG